MKVDIEKLSNFSIESQLPPSEKYHQWNKRKVTNIILE